MMKAQFDIERLINRGEIKSELDFERALIAERKLRVLSKENPDLVPLREKLRELLEDYENKNWSLVSKADHEKLTQSDTAEIIAEQERLFLNKRKEIIKSKLKALELSQQDLGAILGHNSKSYISELINGIKPFSMKDLIVINRLLKIEFTDLIPAFLTFEDQLKIKTSIEKLANPRIKLSLEDFRIL